MSEGTEMKMDDESEMSIDEATPPPTPAINPRDPWTGWFKRSGKGSKWEAVCSGENFRQTWLKLLALTGSGERVVLLTGRNGTNHPDDVRRVHQEPKGRRGAVDQEQE
jgi:hypothetical protein